MSTKSDSTAELENGAAPTNGAAEPSEAAAVAAATGSAESAAAAADVAPDTDKPEGRNLVPIVVAALLAVAVILAAFFGYKWYSAENDISSMQTAQTDREIALNTARDYTARSLTYDYNSLDEFFAGVKQGASQSLQDRYDGVHDALTAIMTESQVVANGQVLSAAIESENNGEYQVAVYATQTTQNIQQPEAGAVPNLLNVTVADQGGQWIVTDYKPLG